MDRGKDRRDLEASAAGWEERGELLGRLEASFEKRVRLDAAKTRFTAERQAEKDAADDLEAWEDEGGGTGGPSVNGSSDGGR